MAKKVQIFVHKNDPSLEVRILYEDLISVFYEVIRTESRYFCRKDDFYRDYLLKKEKRTFYYLVAQRIKSSQIFYTNVSLITTSNVYPNKKHTELESYRNNPNYKILQECEITVEID